MCVTKNKYSTYGSVHRQDISPTYHQTLRIKLQDLWISKGGYRSYRNLLKYYPFLVNIGVGPGMGSYSQIYLWRCKIGRWMMLPLKGWFTSGVVGFPNHCLYGWSNDYIFLNAIRQSIINKRYWFCTSLTRCISSCRLVVDFKIGSLC